MMLKWLVAPVVVYGAFVALVYVAQREAAPGRVPDRRRGQEHGRARGLH